MLQSSENRKTCHRYSREFKAEAVKMVTPQGLSQSEASKRLGISASALCGWVRQLSSGGQLTDVAMQAKIQQLEQENRRLKLEREILKRTATFFASESR
jgi:transposase